MTDTNKRGSAVKRYQESNKIKNLQTETKIFQKICSACKQSKCSLDFPKDLKTKDGFRYQCKSCAYTAKKKKYHNDPDEAKKNLLRNYKTRKRNRIFIYNYLTKSSCIDCGDSRWQVLDFDHVRGNKINNIADLVHAGVSIKKLEDEIAKCEVRCANCHRIKTSNQLGFYPYLKDQTNDSCASSS